MTKESSPTLTFAFCVFCVLLVTLASLWCTNLPAAHGEYWLRDGGLTLNTAADILRGKRLYLDIFYQYGSLPIYLYVLLCRVLSNSVNTYLYYLTSIHLACYILIVLAFKASRFSLGATALAMLALLSVCLAPLGLQYTFEELLILGVIVLWQPPLTRTWKRNLSIGIALGLMQFVRFGAAAGPIIGLVAVDLLSLYACESSKSVRKLRVFLTAGTTIFLGFASVEAGLLAHLFLTLPTDVARDVAWPSYMLRSYDAYNPLDRHPRWLSVNYFLGNQLTAVVGAICMLAFLGYQLLSRTERQRSLLEGCANYRFLIAGVAYGFYALFFYKQVWHYYVGFWLLALGIGPLVSLMRTPGRLVCAVLLVPGFLVAVRPLASPLNRLPENTRAETPSGEAIWMNPETARHLQDLAAAISHFRQTDAGAGANAGVIFWRRRPVTDLSFVYFFYLMPQAVRQTMIFPNWIRSRDLDEIEHAVHRGSPIVLIQEPEQGKPPKDICQWRTYAFPRNFCDRISGLLGDPIPVDGASWIFPSKKRSPT